MKIQIQKLLESFSGQTEKLVWKGAVRGGAIAEFACRVCSMGVQGRFPETHGRHPQNFTIITVRLFLPFYSHTSRNRDEYHPTEFVLMDRFEYHKAIQNLLYL